MSPEKILTHALFGTRNEPDDEREVRRALADVLRDGWVILKPDDCCANAIGDLDAEVWTP